MLSSSRMISSGEGHADGSSAGDFAAAAPAHGAGKTAMHQTVRINMPIKDLPAFMETSRSFLFIHRLIYSVPRFYQRPEPREGGLRPTLKSQARRDILMAQIPYAPGKEEIFRCRSPSKQEF